MQGRFLLLVTTLLAVAPSTVFAGFDFSDNGQSIDITNMPSQSKPVAYTPARAPGEPERLTKASRPESDPTAPALQVYNERYLPDSIKKKYKLNDAWYGIGQTPPQAQPQPQVQPQSQLQPAIQPQLAPQPITQPPVPKPAPTPSPLAEKPPEPFIVDDGPALPGQPLSLTEVKPPENAETWRARKGEPVRDIIKRWSQRDGTDLMWATPDDPILDKDVSYVGTLENAVTQLLRTTGKELYTQYRSDGLTPVMMSPASSVTTTAVAATDTKTAATPLGLFKPKPVAPPEPETRWFALSGASLLEVLQVWAEDSHTQLIWQASSTYALKDSVSQVGHFEDAVFKALSQYDDDAERPVGQLYADPATSQKVLLIRNDTTS